jgi:hypothetical protein
MLSFVLMLPALLHPQTQQRLPEGNPDAELADFQFGALAAQVKTMPPGPERDYFAGVLANRTNQTAESIRLLSAALPALRASQPARAAIALETLAYDDNKSFHYADAARAFDELRALKPPGDPDDAGVAHVLGSAPPQTITWNGPVHLKTERNPMGLLVTDLTVNGVQAPWLLDTGANQSVVSRSFARRLKLDPLPGNAETQAGITGIENPMRIAVLPEVEIGGATVRNIVVLILDDSNLHFNLGKTNYQIDAVLGYPVFQALGAVTFEHNGWFDAGPSALPSAGGSPLYMDLLTPVIVCDVEGQPLPFSLDTGAESSELSLRYYRRFLSQTKALAWKRGKNQSWGAGGLVKRTIYLQPKLSLAVGGTTATLEHVSIFTGKMGGIDEFYGNLGQDLLAPYASFTIDFTNMRFRLGPPLQQEK